MTIIFVKIHFVTLANEKKKKWIFLQIIILEEADQFLWGPVPFSKKGNSRKWKSIPDNKPIETYSSGLSLTN